jgi:hypothetical protein
MATTRINGFQQFTTTGPVSFNGQQITNLAGPTLGSDAVNKDYVDGLVQGLDLKGSVRAATTPLGGNVTLTGAQTIDGVALSSGDRVLVKNQTLPAQNGIYTVAVGSWARSFDADNFTLPGGNVTTGMYCFVEEGTVNKTTGWVMSSTGTIVLDTTPLTFVQFSGAGEYTAGNGLVLTGNAFEVVPAGSGLDDGTGRLKVTADTIDLCLTGVTAGTYGNTGYNVPNIQVDAYGRLTTATGAQNRNLFPSVVIGEANKVFANPDAAAGAPTFRLLVNNDLPVVAIVKGGTGQTTALAGFDALAPTTVTGQMTAFGATTTVVIAPNITTVKQYLSGTGTGAVGAVPVWATISGGDITGAALTIGNDTNITLTLGGTPATALLRAASVTVAWTGSLAATRGGTGIITYVLGDTLYASAADTLSRLAGNTTTTRKFLRQIGTGTISAAPAWDTLLATDIGSGAAMSKVDDTNITLTLSANAATSLLAATTLTLGWTGNLATTRGGTGLNAYALGDILYASATNVLARLAGNITTTRKFLRQTGVAGVSAAPVWDTLVPEDIIGLSSHQIFKDTLSTVASPTVEVPITPNNTAGPFYIYTTGTIVPNSECIFVNGILQQPGAGNDYTISGLAVTFLAGALPQVGDKVLVNYILA